MNKIILKGGTAAESSSLAAGGKANERSATTTAVCQTTRMRKEELLKRGKAQQGSCGPARHTDEKEHAGQGWEAFRNVPRQHTQTQQRQQVTATATSESYSAGSLTWLLAAVEEPHR